MKHVLFLSLIAAIFGVSPLHAEPKSKRSVVPIEPPVAVSGSVDNSNTPRITEFQADDLSLVLRTLARQARVTLVVSERVRGSVTLRIENKTPREIIDIVAKANELIVDEQAGVLYVKRQDEFRTKEMLAYEGELAYEARPDVARKQAAAKKALFDALLAEKFTREEALQIVLAHRGLGLDVEPAKKTEPPVKR